MATSQEVADLVQELDTIGQHLADAKNRIEAEYAQLEGQLTVAPGEAPAVDLNPLKDAVSRLAPVVDAVDSLKASPPVATVVPPEGAGSQPEVTPPAAPASVPAPPLTAGGDAFAPGGAHQTVEPAAEEAAEPAAEEAGEAEAPAQGAPPA